MKKWNADFRSSVVCVVLFFGTLLLFSRALQNGFIDLDDPDYVTQNPHVLGGLNLENVKWAFSSTAAGNWHPLTWLSLMLDAGIGNGEAFSFHATNILLHAVNSVLAFLLLRKLTGTFWTSAFCAALFAWHPLRVESVAWIAERKDVLSGLFFMLTLLAYKSYTTQKTHRAYLLTLLLFALGLLSKPMLVTVPFALLLLDFWPLQRLGLSTIRQRVVEKIPFIILAAISCAVTFHAQKNGGAVVETLSLWTRIGNAIVSIFDYLGKFFWPFNLSVAYPIPQSGATAVIGLAAILICAFSAVAIWQMRRRPWLLVGWFWFLGMLIPVLGFVQVGLQAMADRYTYLPMLGFQIALLWALREVIVLQDIRALAATAAALSFAGCATLTWNQIRFWQSSETLYEHALAVTQNNYLAESDLGTTLFNKRDFAGAELHFQRAVKLKPDFATAHFKLAATFDELDRPSDALDAYKGYLKLRPHDALANYNVGVLILNENQPAKSVAYFQAAIENKSDYAAAFVGLALAKMQLDEKLDAIAALQRALKLDPDFPGATETLAQLQQK